MNSAPSQPQGGDERVYHVLEGPQEEEKGGGGGEEEEREYHLLGEVGTGNTYEVPISTIPAPAPAQPAAQQVDEPLNRLQHQ
jgi:hypothetical protein